MSINMYSDRFYTPSFPPKINRIKVRPLFNAHPTYRGFKRHLVVSRVISIQKTPLPLSAILFFFLLNFINFQLFMKLQSTKYKK